MVEHQLPKLITWVRFPSPAPLMSRISGLKVRYLLLCVIFLLAAGIASGDSITSSQRVLSLSPGLTETLYALELGDLVVGRSDYCDFPPQVLDLPSAGTSMAPNFEVIAGLHPTLILTESNAGSSMFELEKLGGLMELPWLTLADTVAGVRALGKRFDRQQQADKLADRLLARLDVEVSPSAPRLLLVLSSQVDGSPIWYIRRNSLHGAAMRAAGARNAIARDISGNASVSVEGLLGLDPDVIIVMLDDQLPADQARRRTRQQFARLSTLQAVQQQHIGVITNSGFLRTGPRILEFANALEAELALLLAEDANAD
jgi:ABC-type Fe3+-hydroxamate transport system substrate-binding protein